jgi:hypothetical protein
MLVILAKIINATPTKMERNENQHILLGCELPNFIGIMILEFQMLWKHVEDNYNKGDKISHKDMYMYNLGLDP